MLLTTDEIAKWAFHRLLPAIDSAVNRASAAKAEADEHGPEHLAEDLALARNKLSVEAFRAGRAARSDCIGDLPPEGGVAMSRPPQVARALESHVEENVVATAAEAGRRAEFARLAAAVFSAALHGADFGGEEPRRDLADH